MTKGEREQDAIGRERPETRAGNGVTREQSEP